MLVHDHHEEVDDNHQEDERRHQEDVQDVQTADDGRTRELSAEEEERGVRSDDRNGLDHAVDDAQAVAGQQVIGEGVAGEAGSHCQDEQHAAHYPVHFAGLAESAREEDAQHVHTEGRYEQQRCPVVNLAHEQAATNVKRNVQ